MQTTLLGLAIALILALITALVGPYFVNWNDHRAFFEAEASRLIGLNVQVAGPIKVSVLPTPAMTLNDIAIGPAGQSSRLRARSLSIELGLGSLMRGEIRAVEARLTGPQFSIGLNSLGQVDWPAMTPQADTVAIEHLNIEDGRVVLTDSLSNTRFVLDKLWFRGQVRSFTGPFRGEGAFVSKGEIHGYRISAGRATDDGIKVKLNLDIAERPLSIEADGLLATDRKAPGFDGSVSMSRPVGATKAAGKTVMQEPWKLTSKVKANAQAALFEQVEFQYGPEERAAKLDGAAEMKFGERPRLQAALSARQLDVDRLVATLEAPRHVPAAATQALADLLRGMIRPSIPTSLTVSIDAMTLGGAVLQAFGGDFWSEGAGWRVDRLDFRAPGFAKINASGLIEPAARGVGFAGSLSVDANDPRAFVAWLGGETLPAGQIQIRPWQAKGDVSLSADGIAVEQLRSELDRSVLEGKLAYFWPNGSRPARLDADLRAGEIDLDGLFGLADGAFAGMGLEPPREISLVAEIGKTRIAGFEARSTSARLKIDRSGVQIERLSIADFGNAAIEAQGRIETAATPGGSIAIDLDARELNAVIALADRFAPMLAEPLRRMTRGDNTARLRATVSLEHAAGGSAAAKLAVSGRIGAVRLDVGGTATGKPEHFVVTDLGALAGADSRFEGKFSSDDSAKLLTLIGLDRFGTIERAAGPARLEVTTTGPLNRDVRIDARLVAGAIDLNAKGVLQLPAEQAATVNLDQVFGAIAGHNVQGKLALKFGDAPRVDGTLDAEAMDARMIVAAALGMRSTRSASEPFAVSNSDLAGRIEFKTGRASLSSTLEAKQFRGVMRFGPLEVVFDELQGELAGGRLGGRVAFVTGPDGASVRGNASLSGASAGAFVAGPRPPVSGRVTLRVDVEASGRSPAALMGSLAGAGTVTLEGAHISGLNPRVFDAVIRAVDLGVPTDANRVRDFVVSSLENGTLPASRVEAAVSINAGQARLSNIVSQATGADLGAVANIDLADAMLDAVLTMTGTATLASGARPTVSIALRGPWNAPSRTIDANALASWLALRAVEQQAKQIDTMEQQQKERERERLLREANVPPQAEQPSQVNTPSAGSGDTASVPPATTAAPPLPPAVTILPVPKPRAVPRAEAPAAPQSRTAVPKPAAPPPLNPPLDLLGAQR